MSSQLELRTVVVEAVRHDSFGTGSDSYLLNVISNLFIVSMSLKDRVKSAKG